MIAIGLLVTVAAAWLSTDKPIGGVALEWVSTTPLPDSRSASIPGGGAMLISDAEISSSEPNISGYELFRVVGVLRIDAGSAVGQARVKCRTDVPRRTIPAKTPGSRASYPRSSSGDDLEKQGEVPDTVLVEFNSHGTDLASLELADALTEYANAPGIVVSWPPYRQALQEWQWGLPDGQPKHLLKLGFASIWRTTTNPSVVISCSVVTAAGKATASTSGKLG